MVHDSSPQKRGCSCNFHSLETVSPTLPAMASEGTDILVVDDDRGIRETLGDVLRDEGHQVLLARDGVEALKLLRDGRLPRLILLDLSMPGMSGEEFLRFQRADDALAAIAVVVLSADPSVGSSLTGVSGWLKKPVDLHELLEMVEQQLRR
jgi:CheY-like chemotaxis protein